MTMPRIFLAAHLFVFGLFSAACFDVQYHETLSNNPSANQPFVGDWRSANAGTFPTPQSCTDLKWNVTAQDATHLAGNFEATCAGGIKLTGTASGVVDGNLKFDAVGTATGLGVVSCPFTLSGTGILQIDSTLRVEYIGNTCAGTISGTEILRK